MLTCRTVSKDKVRERHLSTISQDVKKCQGEFALFSIHIMVAIGIAFSSVATSYRNNPKFAPKPFTERGLET